MPRTFKATIVLVLTLILLSLLTMLNVWQTNSAEDDINQLQQQVENLQETTDQLVETVNSGVNVSGSTGGGGGDGDSGGPDYHSALDDEDNILSAPTEPLIPADAKKGGTLRRVLVDDPKGFNWLTENSADVSEIQEYVHSTYADRDLEKPDKWVPELAYKIEVNDDYTEYTIHIRDEVYWQPPNVDYANDKYDWIDQSHQLDAEDCKFFFEMVKNSQVQAGAAKSYYKDVEKVEVIDDTTFKVVWKEKTFQSMPATMEAYPLPKHIFTRTESGEKISKDSLGMKFNSHWAARHPIGVGAYNFVKYEKGTRVVLEENERYYGQAPPLERIEYNIIKEPKRRFLKLKADEIDFTQLSPPIYKRQIQEGGSNSPFNEDGPLKHDTIDRFAYSYIGWNMDKEMFSDKKVRRALTMSFNREGIINNVYNGLGNIQTGPFFYKHPANSDNVDPLPFDLNKASSLLEEAGWSDTDGDGVREGTIDGSETEFTFTITAYNQPTWKSALSVYKEDLRKIGVNMDFSPVDWPTMQKKMNEKNFDAYTGGWALAWAIDPYQIWHSSQADIPKGSNRVGFRNDKADELIEKMRATFDREKRLEYARDFHEILHEQQPYTFFRAPEQVYGWNKRLSNVVFQKIRPQALSLPWYIKPGDRLN